MQIVRNRIFVSGHVLKKLEHEFGVSRISVYNALKDITQSDLAKNIRRRAKAMLIEEANSIEE